MKTETLNTYFDKYVSEFTDYLYTDIIKRIKELENAKTSLIESIDKRIDDIDLIKRKLLLDYGKQEVIKAVKTFLEYTSVEQFTICLELKTFDISIFLPIKGEKAEYMRYSNRESILKYFDANLRKFKKVLLAKHLITEKEFHTEY